MTSRVVTKDGLELFDVRSTGRGSFSNSLIALVPTDNMTIDNPEYIVCHVSEDFKSLLSASIMQEISDPCVSNRSPEEIFNECWSKTLRAPIRLQVPAKWFDEHTREGWRVEEIDCTDIDYTPMIQRRHILTDWTEQYGEFFTQDTLYKLYEKHIKYLAEREDRRRPQR